MIASILTVILSAPPSYVPRNLPTRPEVATSVEIAAALSGLDPLFVLALVRAESGERKHVRGDCRRVRGDRCRAWGLYQIHTQYAGKIAPWLYQDFRDPVQQALLFGAHWNRLVRKYRREWAARVYACGRPCKPGWTLPPRWVKQYRELLKEVSDGDCG